MSNRMSTILSWIAILITISILTMLVVGIIDPSKLPAWVGTGKYEDVNGDIVNAPKTLWDLMDLLIIPIVLALGAFLFDKAETKRQEMLAENQAQENLLQTYIKEMSELLLNRGLLISSEDMPVRILARTLTRVTLHALGPSKKSIILSFLKESSLINDQNTIISLAGADLRGINLKKSHIQGINFSNANLMNAQMDEAILRNSILVGANLSKAVLRHADLNGAKMNRVILKGADLSGSSLDESNLEKANLSDAHLFGTNINTDLTSVKLTGALYNTRTKWPKGFDPQREGARLIWWRR